jgi:hypothetical protein
MSWSVRVVVCLRTRIVSNTEINKFQCIECVVIRNSLRVQFAMNCEREFCWLSDCKALYGKWFSGFDAFA